MHFGGLEDYRQDSTALHITLMPQLGDHRHCGLAICTFHLGFSLAHTGSGPSRSQNSGDPTSLRPSVIEYTILRPQRPNFSGLLKKLAPPVAGEKQPFNAVESREVGLINDKNVQGLRP